MKVGDKVIPATDRIRAWLQEPPSAENRSHADPMVAKSLAENGFVTVANRWKTSCNGPHWISFEEAPKAAFPEKYFTLK